MKYTLDLIEPLDWRQFMIAIRKLANSFNYGTDHSPFLGSGVEYVQSRPYQFGDSVRSIDWRITARVGKFFVKEFETPKQMPVYLLLDTSSSMMVSSIPKSKLAIGIQIAGGLALACLDRVSPVGMLTLGDDAFTVEPSLSKDQVLQWLHRFRRFPINSSTHLVERLRLLTARCKNRALIVVITDLHEPEAIASLKLTAQRHDCVVIQMQDPAEKGLRGAGMLRAREPETGRVFSTHGRANWFNQEQVEAELKRAGISHFLVETNSPFSHRLRWFFRSRGTTGKGAR